MKYKKIITYTILICFLFFSINLAYSEKDKSNVYNLFDFYQSEEVNSVILNSDIKKDDLNMFLSALSDYSKNHNINLISNIYKMNKNGEVIEIDYYISSNNDYLKNEILEDLKLDEKFDLKEQSLSSKKSDDKNKEIFLFNKFIDIEINYFDKLKDVKSNIENIHYFAKSENDKNQFEEFVINNFSSLIVDFGISNTNTYDMQKEMVNIMQYFVLIAFCIFLIINLFDISKKLKTISILRILSYKFIDIYNYIFKKDLLLFAINSAIVPLTLYVIFIRSINFRALDFLLTLYLYLILIFTLYIFISIILLFILYKTNILKFIKEYNFNKKIFNIAVFSSIILLIFLSGLLDNNFKDLFTDKIKVAYNLNKKSKYYKDTIISQGINQDSQNYMFDEMKYFIGEESKVNSLHKSLYKELNDTGNLYKYSHGFMYDNMENSYGITYLNRKYYEDLNIYLSNKNVKFDFNSMENNTLYLFMHIEDFNKLVWQNAEINLNYENIKFVFYDNIKLKDYENFIYETNKHPLVAISLDEKYLSPTIENQSIITNMDSDDFNEILEKYDMKDKINFVSGESLINESKQYLISSSIPYLVRIIPGIIVSLILMNFVSYFYFHSEDKKLALYKLNGWKKIDALKEFYINISTIFLIVLIGNYMIFKSFSLYYIIIIFIICVTKVVNAVLIFNNIDVKSTIKGRIK